MGTDRDPVAHRELDSATHGVLVARMPTTRDVHARDKRHDGHVRAGAFPKIAIEVDRASHALSTLTSGRHARYLPAGATTPDRANAGGTGERVVRERRVPRGPIPRQERSECRARWGGCGERATPSR